MNGFISTKVHGASDYLSAIVVAASPWLFGFSWIGGAALFIPLYFGILQFVMAMFSNNEMGLIKVMPMPIHLVLDVLAGFVLIVAPFLYKFYPYVFWPHVLLGLFLMGAGIFTKGSPFLDKFPLLDSRGM